MALHVNRKQRFLHDILYINPAPDHFGPSEATHEASCTLEKFAIGSFISRDGGTQQAAGSISFAPTKLAFLPCSFADSPLLQGLANLLFNLGFCRSRNRVYGRM
jgi:hypothetical protein